MAQMSRNDERMPFDPDSKTRSVTVPDETRRTGYDSQDSTPVTAPWTVTTATGEPPEARRIDRIAARAYELYQRRGGEHGQEMQDWLEAERQIDGADDEDGRI
jgi:hypothetical protein